MMEHCLLWHVASDNIFIAYIDDGSRDGVVWVAIWSIKGDFSLRYTLDTFNGLEEARFSVLGIEAETSDVNTLLDIIERVLSESLVIAIEDAGQD